MKKLYLDDIRTPKTDGWEIVRTYNDFVKHIETNGVPDVISFDHDLAKEETGYDAAKWLCEYCWTNGLPLPEWNVHSANPVGSDNIKFLLNNFEKKYNN